MGVYEKHLAAIKLGSVDKTNIIGMRKALNATSRRGNYWTNGITSPKITPQQASALVEAVREHRPRVTEVLGW